MLEKTVNAFDNKAADIVVWGWTELKKTGSKEENPIEKIAIEKWRELMQWGLNAGLPLYASRVELWENLEKFPDDVKITDDVWLTSQIASKAERIISLNENLYVYDRRNINSDTHSYDAKRLYRDAITFYRVLKRNRERKKLSFPCSLKTTHSLLVSAYCVNQVKPTLTEDQIDFIKAALKDLNDR